MSTRGRFFGISKKREAGALTLAAALLWALLGLFQTTCIVTDEIKFEDAINNPPEVLLRVPDDEIYIVCLDSGDSQFRESFEVFIWEPDEDNIEKTADLDDLDLKAIWNLYSNPILEDQEDYATFCNIRLNDELVPKETGSILKIVCDVRIPMSDFEEYPLSVLKVIISDKGFNSLKLPKEGARTVEVNWALKAEECF